jgi:hypothetical protein
LQIPRQSRLLQTVTYRHPIALLNLKSISSYLRKGRIPVHKMRNHGHGIVHTIANGFDHDPWVALYAPRNPNALNPYRDTTLQDRNHCRRKLHAILTPVQAALSLEGEPLVGREGGIRHGRKKTASNGSPIFEYLRDVGVPLDPYPKTIPIVDYLKRARDRC